MKGVNIIGGGLAGSEAAWQLARRKIPVTLFEMKPRKFSPVHVSANLAELVCSNSLGSSDFPKASFLLKEEMKILDSLVIEAALVSKVPAGRALAVDREIFSGYITDKLNSLENLRIVREEILDLPDGVTIVATGPLTSDALSRDLRGLVGEEFLYFYDSVSPIVDTSSVDVSRMFDGARYEPRSKDYLNIPLSKKEYFELVSDLKGAAVIPLNPVDKGKFFEACLPVEEMAKRGDNTLSFGPLKPVGFPGRKIGDDFYAVIQLRMEDRKGSMHNLVGFQTRMTIPEQKRVFRRIPGLAKANFLRFGKMHRNTYINSRKLLNSCLNLKGNANLYFAGQIAGVEGYLESAATGLAVSLYIFLKTFKTEEARIRLPLKTMMGSLINYVTSPEYDYKNFQPINSNFAVLREHYDALRVKRKDLKAFLFDRAIGEMKLWRRENFKKSEI